MAHYELSNAWLSRRNARGLIELIEPGRPGVGGGDLVFTILKPVADLLYGSLSVCGLSSGYNVMYLIGFHHYLSLLLFFFG
jgi:hypothetical protein